MRKLGLTSLSSFFAVGALLTLPACQDKPAEKAKPAEAKKAVGAAGDEEKDADAKASGSGKSEGDDGFVICDSLKKAIKGDTASALDAQITEYCNDESIETLRSKEYVFEGKGSVALAAEDPVTNGDTTSLKIFTSMLIPVTPVNYFKMMKLSLTEPTEFKNKGFKYDTAIDLTVSSKSAEKSSFKFSRDAQSSDEANVEYDAKAYFLTLQEGNAYAIATVSSKGIKTVKSLKVLALILKKGENTEVFSISEQSFENQGKAESAVQKYKARIASEVKKNFENGKASESSFD